MKNGAMIGSKFLNFGILNLEALPERFSRYDQIPSLDRVVLGNLKSKISKNPQNFSFFHPQTSSKFPSKTTRKFTFVLIRVITRGVSRKIKGTEDP